MTLSHVCVQVRAIESGSRLEPVHPAGMPRVRVYRDAYIRRVGERTITSLTRRDVADLLRLEATWHGRLSELDFAGRVWDLAALPSHDPRFDDAGGDIWQHVERNPGDWDADWIFTDVRFLAGADDDTFLQFLCETLHPVVRPDVEEVQKLVAFYNEQLAHDGWQLVGDGEMSGRPIYRPTEVGTSFKQPSSSLNLPAYTKLADPRVVHQHLKRIESGVGSDPAAAIGASKELVESVCKVILDDYGVAHANKDGVTDLYKKVSVALEIDHDSVANHPNASRAAHKAVGGMAGTVQAIAEIRNELGTGHGHTAPSPALERHARLAFNAATAVVEFLLDTWHVRPAPSA